MGGRLNEHNGCWRITQGRHTAVVVLPPTATIDEVTESITMPDGTVVDQGVVVVYGDLYDIMPVSAPDHAAETFDQYVDMCAPDMVIVATEMRPHADIDVATATELVRGLDGSDFTTHSACGFSRFIARTSDELTVLWLELTTDLLAAGAVVDLPAPEHPLHLAVGELQTSWFCDDVEGRPFDTPRMGIPFEIVGGRLQVVVLDVGDDCSDSRLELELAGLVVRTPGEDIEFSEPVTLTSESCYLPG